MSADLKKEIETRLTPLVGSELRLVMDRVQAAIESVLPTGKGPRFDVTVSDGAYLGSFYVAIDQVPDMTGLVLCYSHPRLRKPICGSDVEHKLLCTSRAQDVTCEKCMEIIEDAFSQANEADVSPISILTQRSIA